MINKRLLVPQRLRRPPASGWSWVDRRFLREHGDYLSREAMLLYLFLAAVAYAKRRELIDAIELDHADRALYDRFCSDIEENHHGTQ